MDVRLVVEVERMNGLIKFLTTEEMIVVYALVGIASVLYLIIYILDKSYYKRKQRQNTKELRKIVDEVSEKIEPEVKEELKQEPVITQVVEQKEEKIEVTPVVESVIVEPKKEEAIEILSTPQESVTIPEIEPVQQTVIEKVQQDEKVVENQETLAPVVEKIEEEVTPEEELQYTSIEPNPTEAQAELMRLTETLEKAEEEVKNIELTAFEEEQEQNAIISLDELMERGKAMYENGEFDKLEDEGNEPISLQDLEERMKEAKEIVTEIEEEPIITEVMPVAEQMVLDDFQTVKVEKEPVSPVVEKKEIYSEHKKFKSSPVISPVYGIEHPNTSSATDIELENTANYEKLDEEIRKTNEFLMTLKELQKKLD